MLDKRLIVFILVFITGSAWALRVQKPIRYKLPWTEEQIKDLNNYLEELNFMQQGRQELDVVTTTKTDANNGEIWIMSSGGTFRLQVKAGDAVRSVNLTP